MSKFDNFRANWLNFRVEKFLSGCTTLEQSDTVRLLIVKKERERERESINSNSSSQTEHYNIYYAIVKY